MANFVAGWTERTTLSPTRNWMGDETSSIYNEQGSNTGNGSILTRDTPPVALEDFEFKMEADINSAGQGGAIVFYANDDGTQYYAITWKMEWSKTTFYLSIDTSVTGGDLTFLETIIVTTLNTSEGAEQRASIIVKVESGLLTFDCNSLENDQHANWQYDISSASPGYSSGHVGYGSYNGWDSSRYTWYFKELKELGSQPSTPRPRFWIIS